MDAATKVEIVHTNIRVKRLSIEIFMPPILTGQLTYSFWIS
jgi:hypothetical protein